MAWQLSLHRSVSDWLDALTDTEYQHVIAALEFLAEVGPGLGRPWVDTLRGSRHANMKELRPRGGNLRLLFAFDPTRATIVLVAGDKTDNWVRWYKSNIPIADRRYDEHLAALARKEEP